MKRDEINRQLRTYIKDKINISAGDREFVSKIYSAVSSAIKSDCFQTGSYARYSSIRPMHDLDIIMVAGDWNELEHNPKSALENVKNRIMDEFINPTKYSYNVSLQTHSVSILFYRGEIEYFAVDIVPAYAFNKNEFGDDTYKVPEILSKQTHKKKVEFYETLNTQNRQMGWITTDPKGYISIAQKLNKSNSDFRYAVKFIKRWKSNCNEIDPDFKMKSFHIEQIVVAILKKNSSVDLFDIIYCFYTQLPTSFEKPQIKDRARPDVYIDAYIDQLTSKQKELIKTARDGFLIKLENIDINSVNQILVPDFYSRKSSTEEFLFDKDIPILLNPDYSLKIVGNVRIRTGGFRAFILSLNGKIGVDRSIEFNAQHNFPLSAIFYWKVKNDDLSPEPRGEITINHTLNHPERTRYKGAHYVECFGVIDDICVARSKQLVTLE